MPCPTRPKKSSLPRWSAGSLQMPRGSKLELALATAANDITAEGKRFALVGGLAISVRAEVRSAKLAESLKTAK